MTEQPKEIAGVDTILGLVGSPPDVIGVSYETIRLAEKMKEVWNARYLAFLPYCFVCKEPLVWHSPPGEDHILFHCPKCGRKWVVVKENNNG